MSTVGAVGSQQPATATQAPANPPAASPFAKNQARFQELATTIMNAEGKASDADQLQAFSEFKTMWAQGGLVGMDKENTDLSSKMLMESAIGQKAYALNRALGAAVSAAVAEAGVGNGRDGAAAARAQLSFYDGLGEQDQKVLFETSINPTYSHGKKFTGVSDWRDQQTANILLGDYLSQAADSGASTEPNTVSDPKLKSALQIADSRETGRAWTDMVLQLFKQDPQDKVDLSSEAQARVGDQSGSASRQPAYVQGSVFKTDV